MKKLFLAALASLALISTPAMADATAVVNVAKIMRDSKAAVSVRNQLQAKQKSFQADLDAKEKSLQAEDAALVKQSKESTDKAAFDKKVKDFREKAAGQQREVQTKKAALDKSFAAA
ncbi:MAG: OmpH family outer membrane protein, partial [Rickettsiales bacterium]